MFKGIWAVYSLLYSQTNNTYKYSIVFSEETLVLTYSFLNPFPITRHFPKLPRPSVHIRPSFRTIFSVFISVWISTITQDRNVVESSICCQNVYISNLENWLNFGISSFKTSGSKCNYHFVNDFIKIVMLFHNHKGINKPFSISIKLTILFISKNTYSLSYLILLNEQFLYIYIFATTNLEATKFET